MYIRSLSMQNLRCFERVTVELNQPEQQAPARAGSIRHLPNFTLLLGDNGSGKTTILRAIALGVLAPVIAMGSGYVPFSLVRRVKSRAAREAKVEVELSLEKYEFPEREDTQRIRLEPTSGFIDLIKDFHFAPPMGELSNWKRRLFDEQWPGFFVVGYSASRRVEPSRNVDETLRFKERSVRYLRVAGLFEENVTLTPLSAWLPRWKRKDPHRYRMVIRLINAMLPEATLLDKTRHGEYLFRIGGSELPFAALSDGYRAHVGWLSDLFYHLCMSCPPRRHLLAHKGIVLVDEIDLHFHPQWQRRIIPSIAQALPNLQFIATTHSPIVAGTLSSANVLQVKDKVDKHGISRSVIERPDEEMYGLSADQILTSNTFGLESTRDAEFFQQLQAEARKARQDGPQAVIRFMRMVSGGPAVVTPSSSGPARRKLSLVRRNKPAARRAVPRKKS